MTLAHELAPAESVMGGSWLQSLVVRGPGADVRAFQKAAASREKPEYSTVRPQVRTQRLSLVKLRALLPSRAAKTLSGDVEEPWDLVIEAPRRRKDGSLEVTYRFQLGKSEPDDLIVAVSKIFPRLCFVVGCVAPAVDEQSSRLVLNGRSWRWQLSARRKKTICAKVPKETEDNADEVTWALAEADWAMMDDVVAHWRPRVDKLTARVLGKASARRDTRVASAHRRRSSRTGRAAARSR